MRAWLSRRSLAYTGVLAVVVSLAVAAVAAAAAVTVSISISPGTPTVDTKYYVTFKGTYPNTPGRRVILAVYFQQARCGLPEKHYQEWFDVYLPPSPWKLKYKFNNAFKAGTYKYCAYVYTKATGGPAATASKTFKVKNPKK